MAGLTRSIISARACDDDKLGVRTRPGVEVGRGVAVGTGVGVGVGMGVHVGRGVDVGLGGTGVGVGIGGTRVGVAVGTSVGGMGVGVAVGIGVGVGVGVSRAVAEGVGTASAITVCRRTIIVASMSGVGTCVDVGSVLSTIGAVSLGGDVGGAASVAGSTAHAATNIGTKIAINRAVAFINAGIDLNNWSLPSYAPDTNSVLNSQDCVTMISNEDAVSWTLAR